MRVTVYVSKSTRDISLIANNIKEGTLRGVSKGLELGARELRDYIKYDLLDGQLVKKRSGKLQRGIYVVKENSESFAVRIRGDHADVGAWLDQGINHTWIIAAVNAKRLKFKLERGPNAGMIVRAVRVTHPGLKPRYFMRAGAEAKKKRIRELVKLNIAEELRKKSRG